jgi:hypothetical protein
MPMNRWIPSSSTPEPAGLCSLNERDGDLMAAPPHERTRTVNVKRLLVATLCVSAGAVCLANASWPAWTATRTPQSEDRPVISLRQTSHEIGQTAERRVWNCLFPIMNAGSRRLILNELDLSCGCGEQVRQTIIIPPGETQVLTVTLDTRQASGDTEAIARYLTNDPSLPRFDLTVRATVGDDVGGNRKP